MSEWDELATLNELYQKGILNEREYEAQKKAILNKNITFIPEEKEMVSMGEAYKRYWKKSFVWRGRATRAEYWWPMLVNFIINSLVQAGASAMPALLIAGLLFGIASIFPGLAVLVRRMHDVEKSAWFAFLPLWTGILCGILTTFMQSVLFAFISIAVLLISSIIIFVYSVLPGTKGDNQYGRPQ